MSKREHQFVNIRHIQHHAAQLIDRVRSSADVRIPWVAAR
jgi:antitoxin (DNA-binding transcriptional repressor) of toxin-antitoxin stability system